MNSNSSNAYKIYESNNITTASPRKLVTMLYGGAIRFCRLAEMAIDEKNIEKKNDYLKRAQDILSELSVSLDFEAGEMAMQLGALYAFMIRELVEANIRMDAVKVKNVRGMLEELLEAWAAIV